MFGDQRLPDRFWSKIAVDPGTECWTWVAGCDRYGYGQFYWRRRNMLAHRAAYLELVGPLADGMHVDHLCHNTRCVNPDHLEQVAPHINQQRRRLGARPDVPPLETVWCDPLPIEARRKALA